ncbi:MAG: DegQ family serine endoprotease, partial [Planctomycetes bacterium]|nr:DegQ family serine endoprotease [Planctomycetota bacterium]
MHQTMKRTTVTLLVGLLVLGTYLGLPEIVSRATYAVESARAEAARESLAGVEDLSRAFKSVAKALKPSVVNISSTKVVRSGFPRGAIPFDSPLREFFGEDFFGRQFPQLPQEGQKQQGLGSGVIVSEDGYILTNNHVVADADEVEVRLSDERTFTAKVVGTDPKTDVAVIKIDAKGLTPAALGDSDELEVGEWVIAVGNPFGLTQTITSGIVSAKGRGNVGIVDYGDFIQTDAAINPGNSGGPLVNLKAEVVGINTAIFSRSGGFMGIGFAIPINMARQIKDTILKDGKVVRGYLGVIIQNLSEDLARSFGYEGRKGALVSRVQPGSPAGKAGLREGDIVAKYDGRAVEDVDDLRNQVAATAPGTEVDLVIFRDGEEKELTLQIGELESGVAAAKGEVPSETLGMTTRTLSPELAKRYGLDPDLGGVLVESVTPLGSADKAGIARGDLILSVQGERIHDTAGFERELAKHDLETGVRLKIRRGDASLFVIL